MRPTNNWDLNGASKSLYDDNAFTPMGPRQTKHYRVHTIYRPKPWATISGAFNDLERHNNTNNNQASQGTTMPYSGPLNHVDHSRVVSVGADVVPNEHYGLDFNYSYSDVYTATNICYDGGASAALPWRRARQSARRCPARNGQRRDLPRVRAGARTSWTRRRNSASASLSTLPHAKAHSDLGYRISEVNGSRFFNDARDVNGSLVSKYQSPYVNVACTVHPGVI